MATFLRFTTDLRHEVSGAFEGLFGAAYRLRDAGRFAGADRAEADALLSWFDEHLPAPNTPPSGLPLGFVNYGLGRWNRWPNPDRGRAVFWLKDSATECVAKSFELAALLRRHGVRVRTIRTEKPGRLLYEDRLQIAAVPFRDVSA